MLLKSAWLELSTTLTQLLNDWLAIGFVPKQWRIALIAPIAKIGVNTAQLILHKVYAKCSKKKVRFIILKTTSICNTNNQHGCLPGRSTIDSAAKVLFDLEKAYDPKIPATAIFFDFATAFDLVPHDTLMRKLSNILPLCIDRWIACYLSGRLLSSRYESVT